MSFPPGGRELAGARASRGDPGDGGLRTWSGRRSSHSIASSCAGAPPPPPVPCPPGLSRGVTAGPLLKDPMERDLARTKNDQRAWDGDERPPPIDPPDAGRYTVVARRYRPQRFDEVVAKITLSRPFARDPHESGPLCVPLSVRAASARRRSPVSSRKCLNCVRGPTDEPCCNATSARRCRSDRTSTSSRSTAPQQRRRGRARAQAERRAPSSPVPFKIYYIDEVHIASRGSLSTRC